MPAPLPISACLICKNAEKLITLALDSVAWCDEIVVVVDTASTDRTAELAQAHPSGKVRVLFHDWLGFNGQRKFSVEQCTHDWVLMLDADMVDANKWDHDRMVAMVCDFLKEKGVA